MLFPVNCVLFLFAVFLSSSAGSSGDESPFFYTEKARQFGEKIIAIARQQYPKAFEGTPRALTGYYNSLGWYEIRAKREFDGALAQEMSIQMNFIDDSLSCVWSDAEGNVMIATTTLRGDRGTINITYSHYN